MPERDATSSLAQEQVDQAIEWLVRLRYDRPSPGTERQFQHWLSSHPHNALAWQRVSNLGDELASLPSELSRNTLEGSHRQRINRRDQLKLLGVLAMAGGLGWINREPLGLERWLADSRTATGERRDVRGRDGSRIQLNTASAIDLRFSHDLRRLTLLQGEVSLDSNGDDRRPFLIDTRVAQLTTQGGQLLLREQGAGLLLAVKRGEVTLNGAAGQSRRIAPGEVLQLDAAGQLRAAHLQVDPWGWTDGVLSVQQMPLAAFCAELSRYRPGFLRCAEQVAELKVSGTFQLADTEQILRLLARNLPVQVHYRTRYWVNLEAV
ncbi:FecR domain-containing protein [Pseudomonas cremoricolorata]|uniref:Iron dicitrate transport regulator FecR n=1 Tax=Pseudomonas cremoricolorata TaxID=157783 RepID=A0A089WQJ8_9PSED|nr:FecR domain-containing protein [Pseudomonas cremoricolorata]AIR89439.1 iron dicitrate transport regulator FecR [Pseudomonas cremoricolorata]